jgi:hypothetical protein
MNLKAMIELHQTMLGRELTEYETRLVKSVYYSAWAEAVTMYEQNKILDNPKEVWYNRVIE